MKQDFIGKGIEGLVKGSPNLNVLNILRSIIEDDANVCYIPNTYTCETKTTTDEKLHFIPTEAGNAIVAKSIQSNKERFNFSINGEVEVYIEDDKPNNTVELVPRKIFRTYTIVRDGKLTIDYVVCKLSVKTFENLRHAGVLYYNGVPVPENHIFVPNFLYKIKLTDIPIVSYAWAQPQHIGLYENLAEENMLSNTLTEVNKKIKAFKEQGLQPTPDGNDIYYIEKSKPSEKIGEPVIADCVIYEVENIGEKNELDLLTANHGIDAAIKVQKAINRRLREIRFIDRCMVMAIENSKTKGNLNWSEPTTSGRTIIKSTYSTEVEDESGKKYNLKKITYKKAF